MYKEPRFAPLMEYTRQLVDLILLKSGQDIKESYVSLLERKHFDQNKNIWNVGALT